jgi:hypothetical protein
MPSAIASTGIATMPKTSASGSLATHSVNGVGRGSSELAVMGRSPIGSPRTLNIDRYTTDFGNCSEFGGSCLPERRFPPPWSVEDNGACFIVHDHGGQKLALAWAAFGGQATAKRPTLL